MMSHRIHALLLCLALAAAPALAQNLVVNGSFEDPDYPAGVNFGALTGWSINPDVNFEVWDGVEGPGANGDQYIEMDNTTCNSVVQTIPTEADRDYVVTFAFGARNGVADNRVNVYWNSQLIGSASADGTNQSQIVWTYYSFLAHGGAGASTLDFSNVDTCDSVGAMLDDVSVVERPFGIPTLDSLGLALLAAALGAAAFLALRRRAARA